MVSLKKFMRELNGKKCAFTLVLAGVSTLSTSCGVKIDNGEKIDINESETTIVVEDSTENIKKEIVPLYSNTIDIQTTSETETNAILEEQQVVTSTISDETFENIISTVTTQTNIDSITEIILETEQNIGITKTTEETTVLEELIDAEEYDPTKYIDSNFICKDEIYSYEVKEGDTLNSISLDMGISIYDLMQLNNLTTDEVNIGSYINLPCLSIYYTVSDQENYYEVSLSSGIKLDTICKLNNVTEDQMVNPKDLILVQRLYGNNKTFDTNIAPATVINNTVIFGNKILPVGEPNVYVSLVNSKFEYGVNDVCVHYFEPSGKIYYKNIACNVRDIDLVDGVVVAYLRGSEDIEKMYIEVSEEYANSLYSCSIYPIYMDSNGDLLITYDGMKHGFNEMEDKFDYVKIYTN